MVTSDCFENDDIDVVFFSTGEIVAALSVLPQPTAIRSWSSRWSIHDDRFKCRRPLSQRPLPSLQVDKLVGCEGCTRRSLWEAAPSHNSQWWWWWCWHQFEEECKPRRRHWQCSRRHTGGARRSPESGFLFTVITVIIIASHWHCSDHDDHLCEYDEPALLLTIKIVCTKVGVRWHSTMCAVGSRQNPFLFIKYQLSCEILYVLIQCAQYDEWLKPY